MQSFNSSTSTHESAPVIRWSAIVAGVVVALGILASLYALGVSTGAAVFDVYREGSARRAGIFVGAFGVIAPFVALFAGGFVAGRSAGVMQKSVGFLHGLTMWGICAIALLWLTYSLIAAAAGGVFAVGKGVAQAGGSLISAGGSALAEGFDGMSDLQELAKDAQKEVQKHVELDGDSLLQPVNDMLKRSGRKPLSADQVERAVRRVAKKVAAEKKIDRQMAIDAITEETSISREDAESVADFLVKKYNEAKDELDKKVAQTKEKLESARQEAARKAQKTADDMAAAASKAFEGLFLALALGAVAAGGGATLAAKSS